MPSAATVRSTSSLATPGSSARTTNSEPLSIRSTRGSRTSRSAPRSRARGLPQKRSSKLRRKLSNHRSTSSNQARGDSIVLARLVSFAGATAFCFRSVMWSTSMRGFFAEKYVYTVLYKHSEAGFVPVQPRVTRKDASSLPLDRDRDRPVVELDPSHLDGIHDPRRDVDEDRRAHADLQGSGSDNSGLLESRVAHHGASRRAAGQRKSQEAGPAVGGRNRVPLLQPCLAAVASPDDRSSETLGVPSYRW